MQPAGSNHGKICCLKAARMKEASWQKQRIGSWKVSETHWISTLKCQQLNDMPQVCSWKTWSNLRQVHRVRYREGVEEMIQSRRPNWHRNRFHQPWQLLVRQRQWLDMLLPPNVDAFKILYTLDVVWMVKRNGSVQQQPSKNLFKGSKT